MKKPEEDYRDHKQPLRFKAQDAYLRDRYGKEEYGKGKMIGFHPKVKQVHYLVERQKWEKAGKPEEGKLASLILYDSAYSVENLKKEIAEYAANCVKNDDYEGLRGLARIHELAASGKDNKGNDALPPEQSDAVKLEWGWFQVWCKTPDGFQFRYPPWNDDTEDVPDLWDILEVINEMNASERTRRRYKGILKELCLPIKPGKPGPRPKKK